MTKSQRIDIATALIALMCMAGAAWRPEWARLDEAAFVALVVGVSLSSRARLGAEEARARKGVWLLPAVALAMAVQWVYFSEPEIRTRNAFVGAAFVGAASALAWIRRRQS